MMVTEPNCRLLTLSDVEQAAHVISQAFVNDPLCVYMLPIQRTRPKTLYKFFRLYGEVSIKNKRGYGIGDPLVGVAFWKFPDQDDLSISLNSLRKLLPLLFSFYAIGYLRARAIIKEQETMHQQYASQPHFYLDNIGVLPAAQGQGLASRLIRHFLDKADQQQVNVYTDTVTRSNVALYEHLGFQCVEERPVPNTGITVWGLLRPSKS